MGNIQMKNFIAFNILNCDLCKKDNSRTLHNLTQLELYDHQMLLCDPNVIRYHKPIQKCLYGHVDVGYRENIKIIENYQT